MGFLDAYIKKAVETTIGEMIAEEIAGQGAPKKEEAGQTETPAGQTETQAGQTETPAGQKETSAGQTETPAGQKETSAGQNNTEQNKIAELIRKEVGAIASSLKEGAKIPDKLTPEDAMASLVGLKKEEVKK